MKKMSRKLKIILWSTIFVICFVLLYLLQGPSLSAEMAFRRAEKRNLTGPAEIIGREQLEPNIYSTFTEMFIGVSDYGYTVYACCEDNWDKTGFYRYIPKEDGPTLFVPLNSSFNTCYDSYQCPVILFPDNIDGASARLTLDYELDGVKYNCCAEGERKEGGYFLFMLTDDQLSVDAMYELVEVLMYIDGVVETTLEFYDYDGSLISSQQFQWLDP